MVRYGERRSGHASLRLAVPSALPVEMRGKVVEVRDVRTPPAHRRQGHAKRLLEEVCNEADRERYFLMLMVATNEDAIPLDTLILFYSSAGFMPIQAEPTLLMVRPFAGSMTRINLDG